MIETKGLRKSYQSRHKRQTTTVADVVRGVDLSVAEGEIFGFLYSTAPERQPHCVCCLPCSLRTGRGDGRRCRWRRRPQTVAGVAAITLSVPILLGVARPATWSLRLIHLLRRHSDFSTVQILRGEDEKPATVRTGLKASFVAENASVRQALCGSRTAIDFHRQISGGPAGWIPSAIRSARERRSRCSDRQHNHRSFDAGARARAARGPLPCAPHAAKGAVYVLESAQNAPAASQKPVEKGIGVIHRRAATSLSGAQAPRALPKCCRVPFRPRCSITPSRV